MSFLSHEQELNTVNILNSTINEIIKDPNFREGTAWIRRQFISNEIIIRQGDISKSFFLIEEGVLRESIHVDIEERRNIQAGISDLIKGDFFGEISLFDSSERINSITAVTNGSLIEINGKTLCEYLDNHQNQGYLFFKQIVKTVIIRMTGGSHRIESLMAWGLKAHGISKYL
ncbi:MAG: cyclic nucleotide-binding domain-containing protein [Methylococcales bacterium]|jgi:CRP-like cAMP-binding protein